MTASSQPIISFLQNVFEKQKKDKAVIAVSGGIDSALSLTLLCKALGPQNVFPLFLPYGDQPTADAQAIATWNKVPKQNLQTINIKASVDMLWKTLGTDSVSEQVRKGNIMARVRMICVFDRAKELDALVCGTENKSEHYLGYFTRFGDAASDIEPICHLYKSQVREMVKTLGLPEIFLLKPPSAGLWQDQTDEQEMGFSYADADKALKVLLGESDESVDVKILEKVKNTMKSQAFKLQVPYTLER